MPKPSKRSIVRPPAVRTRRAYFDCQFGQLHVRTAFPTTGGFDERVTLFCLHPAGGSSRLFSQFLPLMADDRSVYAPDLPGSGESDPPATPGLAQAAAAVSGLASDLRLRQVDVLGFLDGCLVAMELAHSRPELVRRLVLIGLPAHQGLPVVKQPSLVLRLGAGGAPGVNGAARSGTHASGSLPRAEYRDASDFAADLFVAAPQSLANQLRAYL